MEKKLLGLGWNDIWLFFFFFLMFIIAILTKGWSTDLKKKKII